MGFVGSVLLGGRHATVRYLKISSRCPSNLKQLRQVQHDGSYLIKLIGAEYVQRHSEKGLFRTSSLHLNSLVRAGICPSELYCRSLPSLLFCRFTIMTMATPVSLSRSLASGWMTVRSVLLLRQCFVLSLRSMSLIQPRYPPANSRGFGGQYG